METIPYSRANGLTGRYDCATHGARQEATGGLLHWTPAGGYVARLLLGCGCRIERAITLDGRPY